MNKKMLKKAMSKYREHRLAARAERIVVSGYPYSHNPYLKHAPVEDCFAGCIHGDGARLIAATPALLAALEQAILLESRDPDASAEEVDAWREQASAAIRAAKGEETVEEYAKRIKERDDTADHEWRAAKGERT